MHRIVRLLFTVGAFLVLPSSLWPKGEGKDPEPLPTVSGAVFLTAKPWSDPSEFPFQTSADGDVRWNLPHGLSAGMGFQFDKGGVEVKKINGGWVAANGIQVNGGWVSSFPGPSQELAGKLLRLDRSRLDDWVDDQGYRGEGESLKGVWPVFGADSPWEGELELAFGGKQYTPRYRAKLAAELQKNKLLVGLAGLWEPRILDDGAGHVFIRDSGYGTAWAEGSWQDWSLMILGSSGWDRPKSPRNPGDIPRDPRLFVGGEGEVRYDFGPLEAALGGSGLLWKKDSDETRFDTYGGLRWAPWKAWHFDLQVGVRFVQDAGSLTQTPNYRATAAWEF